MNESWRMLAPASSPLGSDGVYICVFPTLTCMCIAWGPCEPADFDSLGLGWDLRVYTSDKLPADVNEAGPWTTL